MTFAGDEVSSQMALTDPGLQKPEPGPGLEAKAQNPKPDSNMNTKQQRTFASDICVVVSGVDLVVHLACKPLATGRFRTS